MEPSPRGNEEIEPAVSRRIEELLARYSLPSAAAASFAGLLALLKRDPLAPTTVREPSSAVDEHLADALVALELPQLSLPSAAVRIADLGAGAGFPGLPLAIARPGFAVTLLESNARKCAFISRAVKTTGAGNALVVNARAEEYRDEIGRFDLVAARALGPPAVVTEYAAPLLRLGGVLVLWRGRRDPEAERAGARAAAIVGLEPAPPIRVHPFSGAQHRYLHLMSKVSPTPQRFPRRPGTARKRPLGAD